MYPCSISTRRPRVSIQNTLPTIMVICDGANCLEEFELAPGKPPLCRSCRNRNKHISYNQKHRQCIADPACKRKPRRRRRCYLHYDCLMLPPPPPPPRHTGCTFRQYRIPHHKSSTPLPSQPLIQHVPPLSSTKRSYRQITPTASPSPIDEDRTSDSCYSIEESSTVDESSITYSPSPSKKTRPSTYPITSSPSHLKWHGNTYTHLIGSYKIT